ncbi:response regulator [Kallotenue papyrolyticum]|uniref:response regulator n=1 Tax=Kallotenue papyrolyticum TaxID=1325125 RepID=UPI00047856BF|nr:response regulator [Kallotenue papyrolyticum]
MEHMPEQLAMDLPPSPEHPHVILVVEDDPGTGQLLSEFLSSEGYDVRWTSDPEEAIALVEQGVPDCVLLDVMLPPSSGYEVCRRIKAVQGLFTPVILLTGRNSVKDKLRGFEAGGDDYVVKPFINDELLIRVRSMIRIRMMEREQLRLSSELAMMVESNAQLYEKARDDAEIKAALLQELNHRVRNNLAAISGFLEMELARCDPGPAQDVLQRATARVRSMAIVHDVLAAHENQLAPFRDVAERLARTIQPFYDPHMQATTTVTGDALLLPPEQVSPLAMVLNELLTNSFRHAFLPGHTGTVEVILTEKPTTYQLVVRDSGVGLRSDQETAGRRSGQQVVRRIVGSYLKGTCEWLSDNGTVVIVEFPKPRQALPRAGQAPTSGPTREL